MKDLFIYHPGTGTMISLSDPVYLIENSPIHDGLDAAEFFLTCEPDKQATERFGIRIDNYNMTNLFFGEDN